MRVDTWTLERVDQLRKLWADLRNSGSTIAIVLGVSRNSVIGKVHRLGLPGRDTKQCMKLWNDRAARSRPPSKRPWDVGRYRSTKPTRSRFRPADVPRFHPATTCQYPLWPEVACVGTYCGAEPVPGYPYCRDHCVMCYH